MRNQYGRSLMEVIGVLAITGVMSVAAIRIYSVIRTNQSRQIAATELEQIVKDTKLLFEMRGDYTGVSVNYLIKAGALKSDAAPIGGNEWSVTPTTDGTGFIINLTDLSKNDCDYFATVPPKWATNLLINGYTSDIASECFSSKSNQVSFIIE